MGKHRAGGLPVASCVGGAELVPLGGIWPVFGQKFEYLGESLASVAIERDGGREVRWAGHGLIGQGGVCVDSVTHQSTVFFEDGCSVFPSRSCQYQWHAHRFPRFLPDS